MDIDDKRYAEDAASADPATNETASANTTAAYTAATETPLNPLRGGRDAGGELGQRQRGRRRRETYIRFPDL